MRDKEETIVGGIPWEQTDLYDERQVGDNSGGHSMGAGRFICLSVLHLEQVFLELSNWLCDLMHQSYLSLSWVL